MFRFQQQRTRRQFFRSLFSRVCRQTNCFLRRRSNATHQKAFKLKGMSSTSTTQIVRHARTLQGSVTLPGDKSISHRYAMLAGIAEGTTRLSNFSTGAEPHSSLACMQALGATIVHNPHKTITITGTTGKFQQPTAPLDCGNSGSTMLMLAGLIAPHPHPFTLIGDHSLTLRPMERIRKPLTQMGARIDLVDGHAPITIHGGPLHAIDFNTPIPSAHVKTAALDRKSTH